MGAVFALLMVALVGVPTNSASAAVDCTITAPSQTGATSTGNTASVPDAGTSASYSWELSGGSITAGEGAREITWSAAAAGKAVLTVTVRDDSGQECTSTAEVAVTQSVFAITLEPSATTVAAGTTFTFTLKYQCSSQGEDCQDVAIDWSDGDPVPGRYNTGGREWNWARTAPYGVCDDGTATGSFDSAKFSLGTVSAGDSGTCVLRMVVTNFFTPNGAELTLKPVVTSSNSATRTDEGTVRVRASGDFLIEKRLATAPEEPALGFPFRYEIGAATTGNWTSDFYSITDTLPVGADLVKVEVPAQAGFGSCTVATSPCTVGAVTVTITPATATAGAVVKLDYDYTDALPTIEHRGSSTPIVLWDAAWITVQFPTDFAGSSVTNDASIEGYLVGEEHVASNLRSDTTAITHGFVDPKINEVALKGLTATSSSAGATWRWTITNGTFSAPYSNYSNVPTDVVLRDSRIVAGDYQDYWRTHTVTLYQYGLSSPIDVSLEVTTATSGTRTVTVPASAFEFGSGYWSVSRNIALLGGDLDANYLTDISATHLNLPAGGSVALDIDGYFDTSIEAVMPADSVSVTNCVRVDTTVTGTAQTSSSTGCRDGKLTKRTPVVGLMKRISQSSAVPGNILDVQLTLDSWRVSSGSPVKPVVVDLLPPGMIYLEGSDTYPSTFTQYSGMAAPELEIIDDYQSSGRQALRWTWPGGDTLPAGSNPGEFVAFKVQIAKGVSVGDLYNDSYAMDTLAELPDTGSGCVVLVADSWDIDQDGNTEENTCYAKGGVTIAPVPAASIGAAVTGSVDAAADGTALTAVGGTYSYDFSFTNTGTLDLSEVVIYDILPHLGDHFVSESLADQSRGSQWQANLAGAITADYSGTTAVEYSLSTNPCREEVYPAAPNCVDDWTDVAPSDLSLVRSVRIRLSGANVSPGQTIGLSMPVQPDAATVSAVGGMAWNSVAEVATLANCSSSCQLAAAEPAKVGIAIAGATVSGIVSVDADADGTRQDAEGVAGVDVLLDCTEAALGDRSYGPVTTSDGTTDVDGDGSVDPAGSYFFDDVFGGACELRVDTTTLPSQRLRVTLDPDSTLDSATTFDLTAGTALTAQDFAYQAASASIQIEKATNGADADDDSGPSVPVGSKVSWTYVVTNTGDVTLSDVVVSDDDTALSLDCGDGTNQIASLAPGASITCTASAAATAGQYTNVGTATGLPDCPACVSSLAPVMAEDTSHYLGTAVAGEDDEADSLASTGWAGQMVFWLGLILLLGGGSLLLRRWRASHQAS